MIKIRTAISSILDLNNLYRWEMSQKLPSNNFDWIEYNSQFTEDFLKTVMKKVMKNILLKLMFNIFKNYMIFAVMYPFFL